MAKLLPTRAAQYPLVSEFIFNFNDTATDINGVTKTFGSASADNIVVDCINLPVGAEIVGGHALVETQGAGATSYTVKLGVSGDDACYLAASDLLAAANTRYALLLTKALSSNSGKNVRATIATAGGNASAGKFRVTVLFKMDGKANEAIPA